MMPDKTIDEVLKPFDTERKLYDFAIAEWGSTEAQAADLSKLHRDAFTLDDGGRLVHVETGLPAEHPEVVKFVTQAWPHLIPPPFQVSQSDLAFLNNDMTARSRLIREMGQEAATNLAKRYGHKDLISRGKGKRPENLDAPESEAKPKDGGGNHVNNPFSRAGWNISGQGKLLRSVGTEKAAAIARSVGATIGATRWNKDHPANQY